MERSFQYKRNPLVIKTFLSILVPTILMNLTTAIGSMADAVIIGQYLDDLSLAVITYAAPVYMVINTIASLFAVGGCIAMGIDIGKGDKDSANRSFSTAMIFLTAASVVMFFAGAFIPGHITRWLGASGTQIFDQVKSYVRIILLGSPIFIMNISLAFFVRNDGRPNLAMAGMFLSIGVDIAFNLIFVGLMAMGVAGAAYSTVLGQGVSLVVIASHFFTKKNTLTFACSLNLSGIRIIKNGVGSALAFVYRFATIIILNHYVMYLAGAEGVVISTVVLNLCTVSLAVFEGLSQTIQPMVSVYYGETRNKKIKSSVKLAIFSAIVICTCVTVVLEIFPGIVPAIFGIADSSLMAQTSVAVRIFAPCMLIMTINVIIGYYLQSVELGTVTSVMVSLRSFALLLASIFLLGAWFGLSGIWASYLAAETASFIIFVIWTVYKRKKLSQNNIKSDWFLLNKDVESGGHSLVFRGSSDSYMHFICAVNELLNTSKKLSAPCKNSAMDYLNSIASCIDKKRGKYVEVEINTICNKIIICDNMNHSCVKDMFTNYNSEEVVSEYGPVLGWNRLYLKGVENNE